MNKSELVKALADQANISLDEATLVVNTFVDSMKDSLLEGGRVEIRGFGSFKVKEYGSYAGRNPRTGEKVAVEPKRLTRTSMCSLSFAQRKQRTVICAPWRRKCCNFVRARCRSV